MIFNIKLLLTSLTLTLMITNLFSQTDEPIQIPTTNVFMTVPQDFTLSEGYKGFEHSSDQYSMIMVTEMPAPTRRANESVAELRPENCALGLSYGHAQSPDGGPCCRHAQPKP